MCTQIWLTFYSGKFGSKGDLITLIHNTTMEKKLTDPGCCYIYIYFKAYRECTCISCPEQLGLKFNINPSQSQSLVFFFVTWSHPYVYLKYHSKIIKHHIMYNIYEFVIIGIHVINQQNLLHQLILKCNSYPFFTRPSSLKIKIQSINSKTISKRLNN